MKNEDLLNGTTNIVYQISKFEGTVGIVGDQSDQSFDRLDELKHEGRCKNKYFFLEVIKCFWFILLWDQNNSIKSLLLSLLHTNTVFII